MALQGEWRRRAVRGLCRRASLGHRAPVNAPLFRKTFALDDTLGLPLDEATAACEAAAPAAGMVADGIAIVRPDSTPEGHKTDFVAAQQLGRLNPGQARPNRSAGGVQLLLIQ